jgi:leucyl/phenylalanyl-tRNA--protein transferase
MTDTPRLHWIDPNQPYDDFPDPATALNDPDGLLAVGGDLHPQRLLAAYRKGIFPWFSDGQPVLWWTPDPRMVLFPDELKVSRSLRKTLRRGEFEVTFDRCFGEVVRGCAAPRARSDGTWITAGVIDAFETLHRLGYAHSVEVWREEKLVGGLYGLALGRVFFGESMFSRATDASKVAFFHLVRKLKQRGFRLIDCQVHTAHLSSLGARGIPRQRFNELLREHSTGPDVWLYDAEPGDTAE